MEQVICENHEKPCMLKTGVKDGPNFGRSFYICGQPDRCDFVKEAKESCPVYCTEHEGSLVELQALHHSRTAKETRHYYRCSEGRRNKNKWCGHWILEEGDKLPTPLKGRDKNSKNYHSGDQLLKKKPSQSALTKNTSHEEKTITNSECSNDISEPNKRTPKKTNKTEGATNTTSTPMNQKPPSLNPELTFEGLSKQHKEKHPVAKLKEMNVNKSFDYRNKSTAAADDDDEEEDSYENSHVTESETSCSDTSVKATTEYRQPANADDDGENNVKKDTNDSDYYTSDEDSDNDHDAAVATQKKDSSKSKQDTESSENSDDDCVIVEEKSTSASKPASLFSDSQSKHSSSAESDGSSTKETLAKVDVKPKIKQVVTSQNIGFGQSSVQSSVKNSGEEMKMVKVITLDGKVTHKMMNVKDLKTSTKFVSPKQNLLKNIETKAELVRKLEHQKQVMKAVNINSLPDKGARLKGQIEDLTTQVANLDIQIKKNQSELTKAGQSANTTQKLADSQNVKKTVAGQALQPGVRQMKITDHITQLPAHVYQQMYAANPQAMTLYGGRMTAARLREVGSITTDAIERLHKQLDNMPKPEEELDDPEGLEVPLMVHQRQALKWLTWRESQHPPGGILADDMGLGKTLTMISLIIQRRSERLNSSSDDETDNGWKNRDKQLKKLGESIIKSNCTLIVCPASLVHQWLKEIERRCEPGLLDVIMYHGPNRERDISILAKADIVLTTYNIISKEAGVTDEMKKDKNAQEMPVTDKENEDALKDQPGILRVAWERIVLDEAHSIKNHKSLTAMSVCRLRAMYRWALTGTPIQNDLLDMYSLLRFLRCSPFDEYKLWKRQVDNKSEKGTQRLNMLVKTLLLRRTKNQTGKSGKPLVALPAKNSLTHELELSKEERAIYDRIFQESKATLQNYLDKHEEKRTEREMGKSSTTTSSSSSSSSNPWAKDSTLSQPPVPGSSLGNPGMAAQGKPLPALFNGGQKDSGGQILLLLLRLRQCCSHLSLMKDALDTDALQEEGLDLDIAEQMKDMSIHQNVLQEPNVKKLEDVFEGSHVSTKIKAVLKHIKEIKEKSDKKKPMKSVIVSQWTKMLEVVERHLNKAGVRCCTIKGDVAPKKRMELVDAFNQDPKGPEVMLVSLRAGGCGLNLIGGNNLFVIDMHWNPALEQQACDRIYRMGQKREVFIHRFICKDTVEERILALQEKKLTLAKDILTGAGASANKLTLADLKMLFGLDNSARPPTTYQPHGMAVSSAAQAPFKPPGFTHNTGATSYDK